LNSYRPARALPHLVLVGGGHSHVQVLKRHRERPFAARVSIVLDQPESVYSGMVPGFVAGQYTAADLTIDVWALARTANVRVIDGAATRIDTERGRIEVAGRAPVAFDTVSIDIGSTVAGLDLPGVREHALATRPIGQFVARLDARLAARADSSLSDAHDNAPIVVVGAGAAGMELAWCLRARTKRPVVLVGAPSPVWSWSQARRKDDVKLVTGKVLEVNAQGARLDSGETLEAALVVWATGASALPLGAASDLPCDNGYICVDPTLQVEGHPNVYAVGDCARVLDARTGKSVPKAGVYAVREGPVLCANLDARLTDTAQQPYVPQRDFLALLNRGDGTAVGKRSGLTFAGPWVWRLKDRIDRRFMAMFQVIDAQGGPVQMVGAAAMPDMACGGCAAKVGPAELHRALAALPVAPPDPTVELGLAKPDDAAVVRIPGTDVRIGLTVDAFTAFCDDPWVVGRVAATNAVNDLYVKGIEPRWALAMVAVPDEPGVLEEVMSGMRSTLDALGISLVGGHSVRADVLSVGLSVTGTLEGAADAAGASGNGSPVLRTGGAADGDVLLLTRGLGSGVLLRANGFGWARGAHVREAMRWMARPHRDAARALRGLEVHDATDVTGFGLYGHLAGMLARSSPTLTADIEIAQLPLYSGVSDLFAAGVRSTFHAQNARGVPGVPVSGPARHTHGMAEIGFDPQTAGPLLLVVPESAVADVVAALAAVDEPAIRIGTVRFGATEIVLH
jgi:selenide,water dikinase